MVAAEIYQLGYCHSVWVQGRRALPSCPGPPPGIATEAVNISAIQTCSLTSPKAAPRPPQLQGGYFHAKSCSCSGQHDLHKPTLSSPCQEENIISLLFLVAYDNSTALFDHFFEKSLVRNICNQPHRPSSIYCILNCIDKV